MLVCGAVALAGAASFAAEATPQAFLQQIYGAYERTDAGLDFHSKGKTARYFTPELARLIDEDIRESAKRNEVGRLDFDPFIGGQEWSHRKIELETQPGPASDRALGTARFTPEGENKPTVVTLDLVKISAGWRIADIHWEGQSDSLVKILTTKD
jgi:hypothetical protein